MSATGFVSKTALAYVEFFRNVPLLVQLFFWFYIVLALPQVRDTWEIFGGLFINNAGISIPMSVPSSGAAAGIWIGLALVSVAAGVAAYRRLTWRETQTGSTSYPVLGGIAVSAALGAVCWLAVGGGFGQAPLGSRRRRRKARSGE